MNETGAIPAATAVWSEPGAAADRLRNCRPLAENKVMNGVRMDKWLWAARFFKTRALAARACELGRVQSNKQPAKPGREIRIGELLQIRTESGDFEVEVRLLSTVRGPASLARTLYSETDTSRELRQKQAAERKAMMKYSPAPEGRPSKRDRRKIIQFRGGRDG